MKITDKQFRFFFSRQYKNEERLGHTFLQLYYDKIKDVSNIILRQL